MKSRVGISRTRILADQGVAHVLLVEDDLQAEYLSRFDLVILPYIPLLAEARQREIQKYVSSGGTVLILGQCGIKDQYNLPQNRVILRDLLEVTGYPLEEAVAKLGQGQAAYIPLEIPPGRFLIPQSAKGEVTTFGPDMADIFPDIPEGYTRGHMNPDLRAALKRVATRAVDLLDNRVSRILTRNPYLELTTMASGTGDRLLAHLVNYNVTLDGTITPALDLKVQLLLPPGMSATSVSYCGDLSALSSISHTATSTEKGQLLTMRLNSLEVYGLLVVEMDD
ncbi:MAG: beta-galactosidase trimerization domain-containing protein [Myxococcales bacterium]|nr:beta-galactosidase trimerization domain-containing protein [Myxococcales bacterium]